MQQLRINKALALTVLGVVLITIGVLSFVSRPTAFAQSAGFGGPWGPPWAHGGAAWGGAPWSDQDWQNVSKIEIVPGTVSAISGSSVTVTSKDGAAHTYALDDKTMRRGQDVKQNDHVMVVTTNGSTTASAVFSTEGGHGPWGR